MESSELCNSRLYRAHCSSAGWCYILADNRTTGHKGDPPLPSNGSTDLQGINFFTHDVSRLQHVSHPHVHSLCLQNPENPGKLQRGQIHRIHYVLNLYRLAGFRPDLFRNQQRLQGLFIFTFIFYDI